MTYKRRSKLSIDNYEILDQKMSFWIFCGYVALNIGLFFLINFIVRRWLGADRYKKYKLAVSFIGVVVSMSVTHWLLYLEQEKEVDQKGYGKYQEMKAYILKDYKEINIPEKVMEFRLREIEADQKISKYEFDWVLIQFNRQRDKRSEHSRSRQIIAEQNSYK